MSENTQTKPADKKVEEKKLSDKFIVKVPNNLSEDEYTRLTQLVSSKKTLLKKALNASDLPVKKIDKNLEFPWFTLHGITGEAESYAQLITAMIKMAKEAQRISPEDKPVDNEKFVMRMFTVRLGLKGDEYKLLRKLLTQNLSGNSAWRSGTPPKKTTKKDGNVPSSTDAKGGSTL